VELASGEASTYTPAFPGPDAGAAGPGEEPPRTGAP